MTAKREQRKEDVAAGVGSVVQYMGSSRALSLSYSRAANVKRLNKESGFLS